MPPPHCLTHDMWAYVGSMLRPRHLFRLMRTNKAIKAIIDNEEYWTKVAAHLVWRGCELMELHQVDHPGPERLLPSVHDVNLYYLLGLDRGYLWGMDLFLQRINETIALYSKLPTGTGAWMSEFVPIKCLRDRTVKFYVETSGVNVCGTFIPKIQGDEDRITMKELARRITHQDWGRRERDSTFTLTKRFVCNIEDAPIAASSKRFVLQELHKLLWGLAMEENTNFLGPVELAQDICLF
jgi:hypothetical protein